MNLATLGWFTTLSTISIVQGMHDALAGLARSTRSGTLVTFNTLLCTGRGTDHDARSPCALLGFAGNGGTARWSARQ